MKVQCNACYGLGHMKRDCKNERMGWMGYVNKLKDSGKFDPKMFGSWLEERPVQQPQKKNEEDLRTLLNNPGSLQRAFADFLSQGNRKETNRGRRDQSSEDERDRDNRGKNSRRGRYQGRNQGPRRNQGQNRRN